MPRTQRAWNNDFVAYTKFIVNHKNYKGMPEPLKEDGSPRWIVSGNSPLGIKRAEWWDDRVRSMKLTNRAEVARAIHPKELGGFKPCQICGKKLSIFYVYPNKITLARINNQFNSTYQQYSETIGDIINDLHKKFGDSIFIKLTTLFSVPSSINKTTKDYIDFINENCKSILSPGVMSNPPDRFEGFHTYNACCRSKEDTGRHSSNLARYSQDRRAYENWADGNWNLSNRLMGEFKRYHKKEICPNCGKLRLMTADHIGPISLGFTHRPKFNPLCNSCNSGKNNRMSLKDIKMLIDDEKNGEVVISWHSKYLWDELKNKVYTDLDSLKLSKVMRWHLHNILLLLSSIYSQGYKDFLMSFLNSSYSFVDYKFNNFNPLDLKSVVIVQKKIDNKNKNKNAERYIRISFESLNEYILKENRNVKSFEDKDIELEIQNLLSLLKQNKKEDALQKLNGIIIMLSNKAKSKYLLEPTDKILQNL